MKTHYKNVLKQSVFAILAVSAAVSAQADVVTVTPGSTSWVNLENSATGSSTITDTLARSGDGSLEMTGDRTRMVLGSLYATGSTSLGLFDQLTRLTFDWAVASGSVPAQPYTTPALRVSVMDNNVRSELIWEGVYNGINSLPAGNSWNSSGVNDLFWRYDTSIAGSDKTTKAGGSQVNLSLANWQSQYYSDTAYIIGFSVGVGGSAGTGFRAFADNVTIDLAGVSTTYNFEPAAADVPEPGSLALLGLGLFGAVAARRKRSAR